MQENSSKSDFPTASTRLFQVTEEDLEVLERELPNLMAAASVSANWNEMKDVQEGWLMVKEIVSNVRWNYGPPKEIRKMDKEEGGSE